MQTALWKKMVAFSSFSTSLVQSSVSAVPACARNAHFTQLYQSHNMIASALRRAGAALRPRSRFFSATAAPSTGAPEGQAAPSSTDTEFAAKKAAFEQHFTDARFKHPLHGFMQHYFEKPAPQLVATGHMLMAEQFKDNALSGQHTWPATVFMQSLIECGGMPNAELSAESERNVRLWYSEFVKNFSFFFSRIDFIAHSLHGAQRPVCESILNDISKMLKALVDAADKQTGAIDKVRQEFDQKHPDVVTRVQAVKSAEQSAEGEKKEGKDAQPQLSEKEQEYSMIVDALSRSQQQCNDLHMLMEYLTQIRSTQRVASILEQPGDAVEDEQKLAVFEKNVLTATPESRSVYETSERFIAIADAARGKHSEAQTNNAGSSAPITEPASLSTASGYAGRVAPMAEIKHHPLLVLAFESCSSLIDCLWARYFAIGCGRAFDRVIDSASHWQEFDSLFPGHIGEQPDLPESVAASPMPRPLRFAVSSFATWSVLANLRAHGTSLVPKLNARVQALKSAASLSVNDKRILSHCEWLLRHHDAAEQAAKSKAAAGVSL